MFVKVKRYKIKDGITFEDILNHKYVINEPVTYITDSCETLAYATTCAIYKPYNFEISITVGFPKDVKKFDSIDCSILIDEDFDQPYRPFYSSVNYRIDDNCFECLAFTIKEYNKFMASFYDILEEVK